MRKLTVTLQVDLLQSVLFFLVQFEIRVELQSDFCKNQKVMCKPTVRSQVDLLQSVLSFLGQLELRIQLQSDYCRHKRLCVSPR